MNDGVYESSMRQAGMLAQLLVSSIEQLDFVLTTVDRAHAVAPMLDPTAYRNGMGNLDDAQALVAPLHTAAVALKPVLEKLTARAGNRTVTR